MVLVKRDYRQIIISVKTVLTPRVFFIPLVMFCLTLHFWNHAVIVPMLKGFYQCNQEQSLVQHSTVYSCNEAK